MSTTRTIRMRPPHAGQRGILACTVRFIIAFCGRRFGKTQLGIDRLTSVVTTNPGLYWWVGLSWRSASLKRAWRLLKQRFKKIPGVVIREADKEIHLPNGSMIWMRTAENEDSLDGEGLKGVIVDEVTLMNERVWTQHLRPALADYKGWALFLGVPKGMNWVGRLFSKAKKYKWDAKKGKYVAAGKGSRNNWAAFSAPTSANPFIDPEEIADAKLDLSKKVFDQEFLAKLLKGDSGVFGDVSKCIYGQLERARYGEKYYAGIDPARLKDYFVVVVLDKWGHVVAFLRKNKTSWNYMYDATAALLKEYNNAFGYCDSTGVGDPVLEELWKRGLNLSGVDYRRDNNKVRLIEELMRSVENEKVSWPEELEILTNEMEIFEGTIRSSGKIKYSAPEGEHDDTVNGLALANKALIETGISVISKY